MTGGGLLSLDRVLWTRFVSVRVLEAVAGEIDRAVEKFGTQTDVPDVDQVLMTRQGGCTDRQMAEEYEIPTASRAKFLTDLNFQRGQGTWAHILVEELSESVEAATLDDDATLRAELVQVAAVAMRWIDVIDHRVPAPDPMDDDRLTGAPW